MTSLSVLIGDLGPVWHAVMIALAAGAWLLALRRAIRDLRRDAAPRHRSARSSGRDDSPARARYDDG